MAEVRTDEESIENWIERAGVEAVDDVLGEGLIAKGGDLSPKRLIHAYKCGVFPWEADPEILWFAPRERMVLLTSELHVGATMRRVLARSSLEITLDRAFKSVVRNCAVTDINDSRSMGTWIDDTVIEAYTKLHEQGIAHSCEAWRDGKLVGGIYGVSLGGVFFAESMFNSEDNAGKIAFVHLVRTLEEWGVELFDCQTSDVWKERFGARLWPRSKFQSHLKEALKVQIRIGSWDNKSE
jgi:leucyl/phenylalanyl-tRNA--protein transferase